MSFEYSIINTVLRNLSETQTKRKEEREGECRIKRGKEHKEKIKTELVSDKKRGIDPYLKYTSKRH